MSSFKAGDYVVIITDRFEGFDRHERFRGKVFTVKRVNTIDDGAWELKFEEAPGANESDVRLATKLEKVLK